MSEVKIKELDKSLIHQANSNSMSGKRGDISAHEYEVYCQKVMSWNIPDSRKQKIVDQIYAKWSEQLRHEAAASHECFIGDSTMSDDGMFCPYKKSTKREVSYSWISRTEITTERFGWCSEKKCMAYNNGRCKMLEEEMAHE